MTIKKKNRYPWRSRRLGHEMARRDFHQGNNARPSPTRRTGLGISPLSSVVSICRPGSATGTAASSLRV